MGFCLFNNIAIAAEQFTQQGKRVLIFDHDVHHGNGTQAIFYDRDDVMYQSFHLSPHYPGTGSLDQLGTGKGKGYTVNAPLPFGVGDQSVSRLLNDIFIPVAEQFHPDLILVSAGFDSHHADPLGGLRLSVDLFGDIIRRFQEVQPRIVCSLEGGYNLGWIGKCVLSQLGVLAHHPVSYPDPVQETVHADPVVTVLKKEVKKYWKI